jgi:GT2 family glycosyltransferase
MQPLVVPSFSNFSNIKIVRNHISKGQSAGRNQIASICQTPFLLQLDDDSFPVAGDLWNIIDLFTKNQSCAAVALALDEPLRGRKTISLPRGDIAVEISAFVGCGCVLRLSHFQALGGYAEWLGATCEEDEYCLRLAAEKKIVLYSDQVRIQHEVTPVSRDENAILYRSFRNWCLVYWVHAPRFVLIQKVTMLVIKACIACLLFKGYMAIKGCIDALVLIGKLPNRKPLSFAVYREYRSKPHHLSFFVPTSDFVNSDQKPLPTPER